MSSFDLAIAIYWRKTCSFAQKFGRWRVKAYRFLLSAVAGGVMSFGWVATAGAQGWDSCSARIQNDQRELNQAIQHYGYDSNQARHEKDELDRDAANCGYHNFGYRNYGNQDNWQNRSYNRGNGDYDFARDNGYRDGLAVGEKDARKNRAFQPRNSDWYEDADRGYNKSYGDKSFYKHEYRDAFEQGYADGYRHWR